VTVEKLKEAVRKILPEVDVVIGYRQGFDPLHATPFFMTKPEQVDQLIWNPLWKSRSDSKRMRQPHDRSVHAGKINHPGKC